MTDWIPEGAKYLQRHIEEAHAESTILERVYRGVALAAELNHRHRIESDASEKE